jgi:hypothetical protein
VRPTFIPKRSYGKIHFIGCDFSAMPEHPLVVVDMPGYHEVIFEQCVGLTDAKLWIDYGVAGRPFRVEVIGGEVNGVIDRDRHHTYTHNHKMVRTPSYYRDSGAEDWVGNGYALSVITDRRVQSIANEVEILDTVGVVNQKGVYRAVIHCALPDSAVVTDSNFWADVVFQSQNHGIVPSANRDVYISWVEVEMPPPAPMPTVISTGERFPTQVIDADYGYDKPWVNPTNGFSVGGGVTSQTAPLTTGDNNNYLKFYGFGFSVPASATIANITMRVGRYRSGGTTGEIRDHALHLSDSFDWLLSDNKAVATNWPTDPASVRTISGTPFSWGISDYYTRYNTVDFGVVMAVKSTTASTNRVANVDYVSLELSYPGPGIPDPELPRQTVRPTGVHTSHSLATAVGAATLHEATNSASPDDSSYIHVSQNIGTVMFALSLGPYQACQDGTAIVRIRARRSAADGYLRTFSVSLRTNSALLGFTASDVPVFGDSWWLYEIPVPVTTLLSDIPNTSLHIEITVGGTYTGEGIPTDTPSTITTVSSIGEGFQPAAEAWTVPAGYSAYSFEVVGYAASPGGILVSLATTIPSLNFFVCPKIDIERIA